MSEGMVKVTFGQLQATEEQTTQTVTRMNSAIDDITQYCNQLTASWTGAASETYHAKQRQLNQALTDLNQVLSAIGRALGEANTGFQTTESQNRGRFA